MQATAKPHSVPVRILLFVLAAAILCALVAAAAAAWGMKYYSAPGPLTERTTILIEKGKGLGEISHMLAEEDIISHPKLFRGIAMLTGQAANVQAGEYEFHAKVAPKSVLESLVEGTTISHRITIPEGLTTMEVLEMVEHEDKLEGPVPQDVKEGELLPETFYFSRGDTRSEVVNRMRRDMRELLMQLWENRRADLPITTPQEALTLASIVEKETNLDREYGTVASVFINRLRLGMKLQADPTVIYAVTMGTGPLGRRLTTKDLRMESPYNTYTTVGLPPTPIANPGPKAIAAVLNPPETDYIFFVADGTGGHAFAKTLKGHNANVRAWKRKLRRGKSAVKNTKPTPVLDVMPVPELKAKTQTAPAAE